MMKHNERTLSPYSKQDPMTLSPMSVLDIRCECGRTSHIRVPEEWTDWHKIADDYKDKYEYILAQLTGFIRDLQAGLGLPQVRTASAAMIQLREFFIKLHERDTMERDYLEETDPENKE